MKIVENSAVLFNLFKITLFWIVSLSLIRTCVAEFPDGPCSPVYITVSSLNRLEMNWDDECGLFFDWVGLFEVDPTIIKTATPIEKIYVQNHPHRYFLTNITIGEIKLPGGWEKSTQQSAIPGPHCMPFWIASFKEDTMHQTNCLKIQPTWMSDKRAQMNDIPLSKLLLPGTHNSGSYNSNTSVTRGEGLHRFVMTQDNDIWTQLVFGIRYLDFRIGYYPSLDTSILGSGEENSTESEQKNRFWINHDLIKVTPLVPLLRDIKRFMEQAKGEIVILDIHRLPVGFYLINGDMRGERHKMLVNLLYNELGDIAVNFKEAVSPKPHVHLIDGPRTRDIWDTNKRLIICYPEESVTKGATWLWPPLRQMWGDKQKPEELKKYIQNVLQHPPPTTTYGNPLWAIMAQLTPNALEILFNPANNLRKMAELINKNLTYWVRNDWWKKSNVIATDFYLGNNLIELSINAIDFKTTYKSNE